MNKIVFFFILVGINNYCFSQKEDSIFFKREYGFLDAASVNPFSPGIKFEFPKGNWSLGFQVKGYWFLDAGIKVEPFYRHYYRHMRSSWYIQAKFSFGVYYGWWNEIATYMGDPPPQNYYSPNNGYPSPSSFWYTAIGGGFALGHQWIIERKGNLVLDLTFGLQATIPIPFEDNVLHYAFEGFPLEIDFKIGRAFYTWRPTSSTF